MNFRGTLIISTLIWFVVSLAGLTLIVYYFWQNSEFRSQQELHKELAVHMRDDNPIFEGDDYNKESLGEIFHTQMLLGPDFEFYMLDENGKVSSSAGGKSPIIDDSVDLAPINAFLEGESLPILGDDPRNPVDKRVFSVALVQNDSMKGYLYVVIGRKHAEAKSNLENYLPFGYLGFIILLLIFMYVYVVFQLVVIKLIKPLQKMISEVEKAAGNGFRITPPLSISTPELQPFAEKYRDMVSLIQQQFIEIKVQEAKRAKHMRQVQHDLKTPLSNVLGYLETWRIHHGEDDPLIETSYKNAQTLHERVNQQLVVAKRPQSEVELAMTTLSVRGMVDEIAERFNLAMLKKSLRLETVLDEEAHIVGDPQLLSRVFDNLMENAIRHCPENSTINFTVRRNKGKVDFAVTNIIAGNSVSGTFGIGIQIVQAILSLHQSILENHISSDTYTAQFSLTEKINKIKS
ncbi:hypothetical protein A8L45_21535 [Veronia pacifica]|uniref:histidine kinase n=1 Tax=Veronia pacifica TaxID=1080227 RepID=A0A1C3E9J2_9GAMM|nr:hypothetical protein A8L45_21535 [Veronia pacifica]